MFFVHAREAFVSLIILTKYGKNLIKRTMILEVGLTGHVSLLDKEIGKSQNIKPLNKFEKWLVAPYVRQLKLIHRDAWKHAIKDVLGEEI